MENNKLSDNLPQLQNLIKRDPESYRDEFVEQMVLFSQAKVCFEYNPAEKDTKFCDLIMFLAQVAKCYPKEEEMIQFPNDLIELLRTHAPVMHQEVRLAIMTALVLLRNRNLLSPILLISVCFDLLSCHDKLLRKYLQVHIVADIKNINSKSKNIPLNKALQDFMSKKLADSHAVSVKTALDSMIDLYKKGVWKDKRTVNIIATACYSKSAKIMVTALKFFLGNDEGEEEVDNSSDSEDEKAPSIKRAIVANKVNKKSGKRKNQLEKIKKTAVENQKKKNKKDSFDFSALHLIHDPQTLAENIFKIFNKRNERFEVKLLMLNMVSRLIGINQLYLPNFFPTLQRFLFPHQREVTKIMMYAAQAAHLSMPPDEVYPVLRTLADNFVTERYSAEVMAMGLNAIREICNRNHHAMDEDLLQDLVGYRNHRDKGVYMAARSLMTLYRQRNPELLARKTRGLPTELLKEVGTSRFGDNNAKSYIPGAEILAFNTNSEDFAPKEDDEAYSSDDDDDEMEEDLDETCENEETVDETAEGDESDEYDEDCDESDGDEEEEEEENEETSDEKDLENDQIKEKAKPKSMKDTKSSGDSSMDCSSTTENKDNVVLSKKEALKEVFKLSREERAEKASEIVSSRFLTDEDFARIDAVQAAKQVERFKNKKTQKRKLEEETSIANDKEIVPLSSIEMVYKKRRHDKASRLQAMLEGREARDKFGSRKGRVNPHASTTNKEKNKSKSFDMVKHKKRYAKMKTSFQDKQKRLKQSLMRQMKNK